LKADKPSQTASMVAAMRLLADHGLTRAQGFADPTAATLLPDGWARVAAIIERRLRGMSDAQRRRALQRLDLLPLRTLAIDAAVVEAVQEGCRQVVILGAGLDGRAHRMPALAECHVFEVDHPATQAYKRERAARLARACRALTYVSVDFERAQLSASLEDARHVAAERTAWIWEGVTMYLTDDALRATLEAVAARSATGSRLLVQYGEPRAGWRRVFAPFNLLMRLWSEPHIGTRSREKMRAEVEHVGLTILADSGVADWAARFGADEPSVETARTRLAVCVKRPGSRAS
jgi:methyltransferase (TIGR00027 family)